MKPLALACSLPLVFAPIAGAEAVSGPSTTPTRSISIFAGAVSDSSYDKAVPGGRIAVDLASGYRMGAAWSADLTPGLRAVISLTRETAEVEQVRYSGGPIIQIARPTGDMSITTLSATLLHDLPAAGRMTPYIGAGLGLSDARTEDGFARDLATGLSPHVLIGARTPLGSASDLFLEARYEALSVPIKAGSGLTADQTLDRSSSSLTAGVQFRF